MDGDQSSSATTRVAIEPIEMTSSQVSRFKGGRKEEVAALLRDNSDGFKDVWGDQHVPRLPHLVRNDRPGVAWIVVGMNSALCIGIGVASIAVGVASLANELQHRTHTGGSVSHR
jgi:hypothetical protein